MKTAYCAVFSLLVCLLSSLSYNESSLAKDKPDAQGSYAIYFSDADQHGGPNRQAKSTFDCEDKIFTVINLINHPKAKHQLSIKWFDPHEALREHTQYPFSIHGKNEKIWAWLYLSRATGAGMFKWLDPALGLEEFIGQWNVEVRIDGKLIERKSFDLIC